MRALILARLRHRLGFALALGLLVIVAVWVTMEGRFTAPSNGDGFVIEAGLMFAAGFVMAFQAFAFGRKTYGYLVHRSTGHRSAFWAILIADCGVLLASQWLFLAAHALWTAMTPERAVALWGNYVTLGLAALGACFGHALGSVAGLLRQRRVFSLSGLILLLFGGAISASFVLLHVIDIPLPPWILWLACVGVGTAVLARLGLAMFEDGVDDDRPHRLPLRLALAALGLLTVAPLFMVGARQIQTEFIEGVLAAQVGISANASGQVGLATGNLMFGGDAASEIPLFTPSGWWEYDEAPRSIEERWGYVEPRGWYETWTPLTADRARSGSIFRTPRGKFTLDAWLRSSDRRVLGIVREYDPEVVPKDLIAEQELADAPEPRQLPCAIVLGRGSARSPFSPKAWPVNPDNGPFSMIVEPQDRTVWAWNQSLRDPQLRQLAFGDRMAFDELDVVLNDVVLNMDSSLGWRTQPRREIAFRCDSQAFRFSGAEFTQWAPTQGQRLESAGVPLKPYRVEVTDPDVVEPRVVIRSTKDGSVLFEHQYEVERTFDFVVAHLASLARAPLLSVAAFLSDAPEPGRGSPAWADPLLRGGRRAWLLALNLLVAAGLALIAWHSLPHPRARAARIAWTIATLLLGFPAFMARLVVEPVLNREVRIERRREPAAFILRTP